MKIVYCILFCFTVIPALAGPVSSVVRFTENAGQITDQYGAKRPGILYQCNTAEGLSVFIGRAGLHYQWNKPVSGSRDEQSPVMTFNTWRLDVSLLGANTSAEVIAESLLPDRDIFYTASLEGRQAASCQKLTYKDIYPGIDWVLYTKGGKVKYDFVVHPGGRLSDIRMQYSGATGITLEEGNLVVQTPEGTLTEAKPYSYAEENRQELASRFLVSEGNIVSFAMEPCKGTRVIDPELRLEWGTYYGGSGKESGQYNVETNAGYWAYGVSVATDKAGNVYLYGTTNSINNIATTGAHQATISDGNNVYLAKFGPEGNRLWCTYFGGFGGGKDEGVYIGTVSGRGHALACDTLGNIYITGNTRSTGGIATPGAHQASLGGSQGGSDLFLARFDSDGNRIWATYFGNPGKEEGGSLAVSPEGNAVFLAGASEPLPAGADAIATPNAAIPPVAAFGNTGYAGFLTCFNALGQQQWGTYISDVSITSTVYDLILDQQGVLYLTGYAKGYTPAGAVSISTPGCHQPDFTSCNPNPGGYSLFWETPDAFLQRWDAAGNRVWGTYYGNGGVDIGYALAADEEGNVYMSGINSTSYPHDCNWFGPWRIATPGSYLEVMPEQTSSFLVKFSAAGQRQWGTFYPGYYVFGNSTGLAAYKDQVFCLFHTEQDSLATDCAFQTTNPAIYPSETVLTTNLVVFNASGERTYATYFGGKQGAWAGGLAVSETEDGLAVYMAGLTSSTTGIATGGSFKESLSPGPGSVDAFLVKFIQPGLRRVTVPCFTADSVLLSAADTSGSDYYWEDGRVGTARQVYTPGRYTVYYRNAAGCSTADSFEVTIHPLPVLEVRKGCRREGAVLASVSEGNKNHYTYRLYREGETLSTTESDNGVAYSALDTGSYALQIVSDACDTTLFFSMEAYPDPVVTASDDTLIAAGQSVQLQAQGAVAYHWTPEQWLDNPRSAMPQATPREAVTYTVTGYNEFGCRASARVHIALNEGVQVPNAFSPNGDGINDEFRIVNLGYHQLLAFRIFNRFGEEVFSTTNPGTGWDGYYRNKPSDLGVYYYYIRFAPASGADEEVLRGDLTLIR